MFTISPEIFGLISIGFIPTFRKSWIKPYEEMLFHPIIAGIKHVTILLALETIGPSTVIYSTSMVAMNCLLVSMLVFRRWIAKPATSVPRA